MQVAGPFFSLSVSFLSCRFPIRVVRSVSIHASLESLSHPFRILVLFKTFVFGSTPFCHDSLPITWLLLKRFPSSVVFPCRALCFVASFFATGLELKNIVVLLLLITPLKSLSFSGNSFCFHPLKVTKGENGRNCVTAFLTGPFFNCVQDLLRVVPLARRYKQFSILLRLYCHALCFTFICHYHKPFLSDTEIGHSWSGFRLSKWR